VLSIRPPLPPLPPSPLPPFVQQLCPTNLQQPSSQPPSALLQQLRPLPSLLLQQFFAASLKSERSIFSSLVFFCKVSGLLSTRQSLPLQVPLPSPRFVQQPCPTNLQRLPSPLLPSIPGLLSKRQLLPPTLPVHLQHNLPLRPPSLRLRLPSFVQQPCSQNPTSLQRLSSLPLPSTPVLELWRPLPLPPPRLSSPILPSTPALLSILRPLPPPLPLIVQQLTLPLPSFVQQPWPTNLQPFSSPPLPSTPALLSILRPLPLRLSSLRLPSTPVLELPRPLPPLLPLLAPPLPLPLLAFLQQRCPTSLHRL